MLRCADLEMDLLARKVFRAGKPLDLLPREFKLLEYFLRHKDRVVTRTMLLEQVWDYRFDPHTSIIDTHISRLRKKLDEGFERPCAAHPARRRLPFVRAALRSRAADEPHCAAAPADAHRLPGGRGGAGSGG